MKWLKSPQFTAGAAALITLLAYILLRFGPTYRLDLAITFYLHQNLLLSSLSTFLLLITNYTIGSLVAASVVTAVLVYRQLLRRMVFFVASLGAVWLLVEVIKQLVARPRPFITLPEVYYFSPEVPDGYSFPSHHAALAWFIAYFLAHAFNLKPYQQWILYLLAALVAISRVYLGAHYTLDVVAGGSIGILVAACEIIAYRYLTRRFAK